MAVGARATAFGLVLEITAGSHFGWERGRNGVNAVITVDDNHRGAKVGASIQDIFQDIMLANDDSVQAVLSKWRTAGGTNAALFAKKAAFATTEVAAGRAGGLFDRFDADAYASFAAISRTNLGQMMSSSERAGFARLWTRFLIEEFSNHFLDVDEAVKLVTTGRFRTSKPEFTADSGRRPDARNQHGMLQEAQLRDALNDNQLVRSDGSYILCFWLTAPGDSADRIGAVFDWRNSYEKNPKKFKLVDEKGYAKMLPLVRDGLVTPIRLFLKKQ